MKRKSNALRPARDLVIIGTPPIRATHFVLQRFDRIKWVPVGHLAEDGVEVHERPIATLSLALIRKHGPGKFRVRWFEVAAGRRVPLGISRSVTIAANEERLVDSQPTSRVAASPEAVSSVAALWTMAQRQADTWAQQHGVFAERAIERERAHFQLQLEQQRTFFNEMERLRREGAATVAKPETNRIVDAISALSRKLDARRVTEEEDEDPYEPSSATDSVQSILGTIGETWMPHLGPPLGAGLGALLGAFAEYVQNATARAQSASTPALSPPAVGETLAHATKEASSAKRADGVRTASAREGDAK